MLLDTHVVLWLYAGLVEKFPTATRVRLEGETLQLSPVVTLELQFLHEIGRIKAKPPTVLSTLKRDIGLESLDCSLASLMEHALPLEWTRDPFDRLLVAHTLTAGMPLLTKDRTIRKHCKSAVW